MDTELADAAIAAVDAEQSRLAGLTQKMTDGNVQAPTQRDAMLSHITTAYNIQLPDMQTCTLESRIGDPETNPVLRELLNGTPALLHYQHQ